MHTNKAAVPDNISAFLLKTFAEELTPVWHQLFQLSTDTHSVPELWKRSVIIPVPEKAYPWGEQRWQMSDDTVILSLLNTNANLSSHRCGVDRFVNWCDAHWLLINTEKTVLIAALWPYTDITSSRSTHTNISGFTLIMTYAGTRCLCPNPPAPIVSIFYRATIESALRHGISSWFGNLTVKSKVQIVHLILHSRWNHDYGSTNILSDTTHAVHPNMFSWTQEEGTESLYVSMTGADTRSSLCQIVQDEQEDGKL